MRAHGSPSVRAVAQRHHLHDRGPQQVVLPRSIILAVVSESQTVRLREILQPDLSRALCIFPSLQFSYLVRLCLTYQLASVPVPQTHTNTVPYHTGHCTQLYAIHLLHRRQPSRPSPYTAIPRTSPPKHHIHKHWPWRRCL